MKKNIFASNKIFTIFLILFSVLFSGCATRNAQLGTFNQSHQIDSIGRSTFEIYDIFESNTINSDLLEAEIVKVLNKNGLQRVNPLNQVPQFFVYYAPVTDLGINYSYEHGLLIFAYDVDLGKKVYRFFSRYEDEEKDAYLSAIKVVRKNLKRWPGKRNYEKKF